MKKVANKLVLGLISVCSLFIGPCAVAAEYLFVANGNSLDLSIIRASDNTLLGKVPVTGTGQLDDLTVTPDGRILLVMVHLKIDPNVSWADGAEVIAFDTRSGKKIWTTRMEGKSDHITTSKDGSMLFVPVFDHQYMAILDTKTGARVDNLYGLWGMHTTRLSADGKTIYVGSFLTGLLHSYDIQSRKLLKTLPFSGGEFGAIGVRPFAVTKDDKTIYAQLSGFHGIAVMDVATQKLKYIRHGDLPKDFTYPTRFPYNIDHGLELSPDEKTVVAVSEGTQKAYIYSTDTMKLKGTVPLGRVSKWVVFSKDGQRVYVSNAGDNSVSVIGLESMKEIARVDTSGVRGARIKIVDLPEASIAALLGAT